MGAVRSVYGDFYPRPPRGGRLFLLLGVPGNGFISIHALREEGDGQPPCRGRPERYFYPRPPRGGRRGGVSMKWILLISIHALREEGDYGQDGLDVELCEISIHALREEGDKIPFQGCKGLIDFYPRPPRGGRLGKVEGDFLFS